MTPEREAEIRQDPDHADWEAVGELLALVDKLRAAGDAAVDACECVSNDQLRQLNPALQSAIVRLRLMKEGRI